IVRHANVGDEGDMRCGAESAEVRQPRATPWVSGPDKFCRPVKAEQPLASLPSRTAFRTQVLAFQHSRPYRARPKQTLEDPRRCPGLLELGAFSAVAQASACVLSFYLTNVVFRVGRASRPSRASIHLLTLRRITKRAWLLAVAEPMYSRREAERW